MLSETKDKIAALNLPLTHPYSRYGLAVALVQSRLSLDKLNEDNLREALIQSIEVGLGHFRMRTNDNPANTRLLKFSEIKMEDLQADTNLVSGNLAEKGIYLFPTIVTTDLSVKKTFLSAITILSLLRDKESFNKSISFSRSFAPMTAKINNKRSSQSAPKGNLLEIACALITSITPSKPAAWPGQNTVIIPDLPIEEMRDFVALFEQMLSTKLDGDLMHVQLKEVKPVDESKPKRVTKKPAKETAPKSEFRRPRLHSGNYPFAPRESGTFGAVGLLGAIGRWANTAHETQWAARVLDAIAEHPLYIVSYDKISQVRFGHHIVHLALNGELSKMVDALWRETKLYADLDSPMIRHDTPAYQLFYLHTSRFLQSFSAPAFADFLASRAEYPPELRPLFEEYFKTMDKEIVQSAGALGQWLNRTAYFVADGEVEANASDRRGKVAKAKAKILIEFESAAMSAKTPPDLLFRLSTRCGRLLQDDAPAGAKRFMDAVASNEINQTDATHLLIAYMRLRAPRPQTGEPENAPTPITPVDEVNAVVNELDNLIKD
jgi:hypothetical protein